MLYDCIFLKQFIIIPEKDKIVCSNCGANFANNVSKCGRCLQGIGIIESDM